MTAQIINVENFCAVDRLACQAVQCVIGKYFGIFQTVCLTQAVAVGVISIIRRYPVTRFLKNPAVGVDFIGCRTAVSVRFRNHLIVGVIGISVIDFAVHFHLRQTMPLIQHIFRDQTGRLGRFDQLVVSVVNKRRR